MKTKLTDKVRIYNVLVRAEGQWVCSSVFFRELFIKDYAQRIAEIRAEGLDIESKKCDQHAHRVFMYKYNRIINQESLL
tara:strand:+ start:1352 stop:1588 length:237 start_codon:yes stop_codon:yes gene_type:complete